MTNYIVKSVRENGITKIITHNVLIVGYTDDDNYIYMDTNRGGLMELGIQNFNTDNRYIYSFVIKNNK